MAMLRKPFHGWRIKQGIQKLTVIRAPSPRLYPVPEWAGSASRPTPTPTPRTSLSPLPPLFFSFAIRPPSTVAYYSRAPEPNADSAEDQLDEPNPNAQSQVDEEMEYAEETLDHFYREMSKEVETILQEGDPRLPEELSRRVVVTCVSEDPPWRYYDPRENWTYVYVLRRKQRKQGSGASAAKSAAKESCRELEVELYMTYSPELELAAALWPTDEFPFGKDRMLHKWKVVNKFVLSSQDEDVYAVAEEEARKWAGWLIAQNKLADKDTCKDTDMGKDTSNATLGKV
ncbi:hypothetical protein ACJRO7_006552 [Eucalyptus globulus]|uniref:Uncharacterized protein n=1 Tax=Eucalyptus globulus TaxID=34317 RepID=A0ABD3IMK5_EUCGL